MKPGAKYFFEHYACGSLPACYLHLLEVDRKQCYDHNADREMLLVQTKHIMRLKKCFRMHDTDTIGLHLPIHMT